MLNDLTIIKYRDIITKAARGQTMTDVDGSLITYNLVELGIYIIFCNRVESCGGLIEPAPSII